MKCHLRSIIILFIQRSDKEAKRSYLKLICIPLLPASLIRVTFEKLRVQIEAYQQLKNVSGAFDRFLSYFFTQWISGDRHVSKISSLGV